MRKRVSRPKKRREKGKEKGGGTDETIRNNKKGERKWGKGIEEEEGSRDDKRKEGKGRGRSDEVKRGRMK